MDSLGRHGGSKELAYILFDILQLNGEDLRLLPLIERKAILAKLLAMLPVRSAVQFSADVTGQGRKFFALACKRHLKEIVSKRANAPYHSGRSAHWQKVGREESDLRDCY